MKMQLGMHYFIREKQKLFSILDGNKSISIKFVCSEIQFFNVTLLSLHYYPCRY